MTGGKCCSKIKNPKNGSNLKIKFCYDCNKLLILHDHEFQQKQICTDMQIVPIRKSLREYRSNSVSFCKLTNKLRRFLSPCTLNRNKSSRDDW